MPSSTILTIFRNLAPEFAAISDDIVTNFISYAEGELNAAIFSDIENINYQQAAVYLAASKLKIASDNSAFSKSGNNITAKKVGNIEIQYGAKLQYQPEELMNNSYFLEYQRIISTFTNDDILLINAI